MTRHHHPINLHAEYLIAGLWLPTVESEPALSHRLLYLYVEFPSRGVKISNHGQSWLWSTALLSCVFVTYSYGISGAFWYGAGCSTIIVFFGYLGVVCKSRIPEAHTILEVIRIRYGMSSKPD
jgi:hypothetical protein